MLSLSMTKLVEGEDCVSATLVGGGQQAYHSYEVCYMVTMLSFYLLLVRVKLMYRSVVILNTRCLIVTLPHID